MNKQETSFEEKLMRNTSFVLVVQDIISYDDELEDCKNYFIEQCNLNTMQIVMLEELLKQSSDIGSKIQEVIGRYNMTYEDVVRIVTKWGLFHRNEVMNL